MREAGDTNVYLTRWLGENSSSAHLCRCLGWSKLCTENILNSPFFQVLVTVAQISLIFLSNTLETLGLTLADQIDEDSSKALQHTGEGRLSLVLRFSPLLSSDLQQSFCKLTQISKQLYADMQDPGKLLRLSGTAAVPWFLSVLWARFSDCFLFPYKLAKFLKDRDLVSLHTHGLSDSLRLCLRSRSTLVNTC